MTSSTQTPTTSALSDQSRQVAMAAMQAVYDPQAVDMLKTQLENTKSKKAIAPTVALAAISVLQQLGPKGQQVPEEEMWGKGGVVQGVLGSLFEVSKELGYSAPHSDLKQAYEIVDHEIEKSGFGAGPQAAQGGQQQQGDPSQQQPQPDAGGQPSQPMSMMGGQMPQGMMQ